METKGASSSSQLAEDRTEEEDDLYGAGSGWVEARTTCEHLEDLSSNLSHIPPPDASCTSNRKLGNAEYTVCSEKLFLLHPYVIGRAAFSAYNLLPCCPWSNKQPTFGPRCFHPAENWLCLSCKDVLCSRFVNKHMLAHHQETGHCVALSYSDLSFWCFACESYLDAQAILQLQHVYEVAHLLKFGVSPPSRPPDYLQAVLLG